MSVTDKYDAPDKVFCPLWQKPMSEVCHKCTWWREMEGIDVNTNKPVRVWDCAVTWQNTLLMENSNQQRVTHKEVAELRNEIGAAKKTAAAIKAHEARMLGHRD